jgi:hypothetical protein
VTHEGLETIPSGLGHEFFGESGLAHPGLAGDHHQRTRPPRGLGQETAELGPLGLPAHEGCLPGEGNDVQRLPGGVHDAIEVPAIGETLEPEAAAIAKGELGPGPGELTHDLRNEDLSPLGPGRDARRGVHRLAEEVVALDRHLPGVDTDPDHHLLAGGELVPLVEPLLDGDGAGQRLSGRDEGHHEAIAEGLYLPAVVLFHAAPNDLFMGAENPVGSGVAPLGAQIRGALNIAEQDRQRAFGEPLVHGRPPTYGLPIVAHGASPGPEDQTQPQTPGGGRRAAATMTP